MTALVLVLLLLAAVCALAYAFNAVSTRVNLLGLAVFLFVLVSLVEKLAAL